MSGLIEMISPKRLHKVVGVAVKVIEGELPIIHVDEGRLYAAINLQDAEQQAIKFWTETMSFDTFKGAHAMLMDRVDGYKIVLVADEQA